MKVEKLKIGNKIKVKTLCYEVVKSELKARYRIIWAVELHLLGSKKLLPEYFITKYKDTGEIFLNGLKIRESDIF